jgi:DNA-binding FadR family transcriptional regulator
MAMTAAERMARLRERQRVAGLTSLSIVVPAADVPAFVRLAARRRRLHSDAGSAPGGKMRLARRTGSVRTTRISPADILAFRELLEVTAVTLVARRMSAEVARRLRSQIAREASLDSEATSAEMQRLHLLLAELSGDEALQLLLRIALQLTDERSPFTVAPLEERRRLVSRIKRLHAAIVDALVQRDERLAVRRVRRYLSGLREWLK